MPVAWDLFIPHCNWTVYTLLKNQQSEHRKNGKEKRGSASLKLRVAKETYLQNGLKQYSKRNANLRNGNMNLRSDLSHPI